jgi:hypothetical protein
MLSLFLAACNATFTAYQKLPDTVLHFISPRGGYSDGDEEKLGQAIAAAQLQLVPAQLQQIVCTEYADYTNPRDQPEQFSLTHFMSEEDERPVHHKRSPSRRRRTFSPSPQRPRTSETPKTKRSVSPSPQRSRAAGKPRARRSVSPSPTRQSLSSRLQSATRPEEKRRTPSRRKFTPKASVTAPAESQQEERDQQYQYRDLRQNIQKRDQEYMEEHPVYNRRPRHKIQFYTDDENEYFDNM